MSKLHFYIHKKPLIFFLTIISLFSIVTFSVFRKYNANQESDIFVPVLMYHNLDLNPKFKKITYTIKPELFEKHMIALKKQGYSTITITELNDFFYNDKPLPKKPILITFDDGKTNNYHYAYPILKKLNMKGNMFVIAHTNEDHKNEEYLDWYKLKQMYDDSVMDIQSHTYDLHHKVNNTPAILKKNNEESEEDYEKRIFKDLVLSKELIEKNIGNQVSSLAYPYGGYNSDIELIAKQAGYKQTYTTDIGIMKKSDSPYLIKRINIDGLCSKRRLLLEIWLLKIFDIIF